MSADQHTPGPWQAIKWTCNAPTTVLVDDFTEFTKKRVVAECSKTADARLIAAAPELLAALRAMLTHMGMDEDEWNKPTFDQARTAIAKATGAAA